MQMYGYMKKTKIIIAVLLVLAIGLMVVGIWKVYDVILNCELQIDSDTAGLRWTILGAMGSWAGSIFGAIALLISIVALWQPPKDTYPSFGKFRNDDEPAS